MPSAEPGNWPVEPVSLYVYNYYPNSAQNTAPTYNSGTFQSFNDALADAQAYITNQDNEGVCVILPVAGVIVYPFIPWQDF